MKKKRRFEDDERPLRIREVEYWTATEAAARLRISYPSFCRLARSKGIEPDRNGFYPSNVVNSLRPFINFGGEVLSW